MSLITDLKKAYKLGEERIGIEIKMNAIYVSMRRGDSSLALRLIELRETKKTLQDQYEQLGFLEKLAFDFGNCNEV